METQDWEGKQLDKDLLVRGNKHYSPDTCLFLDQKVNKFITDSKAARGDQPIGVTFHKSIGKYVAECNLGKSGNSKYLGYFNDAEEAHAAWLEFKIKQAHILASEQTDERVAIAIIKYYENYHEVKEK